MFERLDAAPSLSDRVAQALMDKIDAGELRRGERMQIDDREEGVVRILQSTPLLEGPDVVAGLEGVGGGLHS